MYTQMHRSNHGGNKDFHQKRLITCMEISETGRPDDRIAALEKKTEEMEALVKGLMAEMLDLKAIAMKRAQQGGEQNRQEPARGHVAITPNTAPEDHSRILVCCRTRGAPMVIRPKSAARPEVTVEPAEPEMVRIMQSDGTMKMEVRRGDKNLRDVHGIRSPQITCAADEIQALHRGKGPEGEGGIPLLIYFSGVSTPILLGKRKRYLFCSIKPTAVSCGLPMVTTSTAL